MEDGGGGGPGGGRPAYLHQEAVEGKAEAKAELAECRAVRTREGVFLSRRRRGLVLQDSVIQEGVHHPGDCVGVEGVNDFFVGAGGHDG